MTQNTELSRTEFLSCFESLLCQLPKPVILSTLFIDIPSNRKPWTDTGIDLAEGENITAFSMGKTNLKGTDLWFGADFQLWFRINADGLIFRGTRCSHTFRIDKPGRLFLASYFPGEWASRTGDLATPDEVYEQVDGSLTVLFDPLAHRPAHGFKKAGRFRRCEWTGCG